MKVFEQALCCMAKITEKEANIINMAIIFAE
jgi:hypothetical protein